MKNQNSVKKQKEKVIDLHKIWAIIQKNFIVLKRDKARILPLLMFPLFMITIFGYTSGNTPKHIGAAIVAFDHSPLAQHIQEEISQTNVFSVRHVVSTEDEAKEPGQPATQPAGSMSNGAHRGWPHYTNALSRRRVWA